VRRTTSSFSARRSIEWQVSSSVAVALTTPLKDAASARACPTGSVAG